MREIKESDWKILRQVHKEALERRETLIDDCGWRFGPRGLPALLFQSSIVNSLVGDSVASL